MAEVYVFDAVRTPRGRGKSDGSLHTIRPVALLQPLFQSIVQRSNLPTTEMIDDCILGCVTPVGDQGANIARVAALYAGWHEEVSGVTINRFCASGLEAVNMAAMKVMAGQADMTVGGGVESMSRVPMGSDGGAYALDPQVSHFLSFIPQGVSADLIASMDGFSRSTVDEFAAGSHRKAAAAWENQRFKNSVVPVKNALGETLLEKDETIRPDTTADKLAQLKPSFEKMGLMGYDATALRKYPNAEAIHHVHHAGNSSGIVDGACLVLLGNQAAGKRHGLKPRARIVQTAVIGTEPTIMLTGPTAVTRKALAKAGLKLHDIDVFEVNEAFAAVVLKFIKDLGVDPAKVNPNGGAIAMGHPLGATGAMLLSTCLDELERTGGRYGLITLCVGAGMGICTIIERLPA